MITEAPAPLSEALIRALHAGPVEALPPGALGRLHPCCCPVCRTPPTA
jgi:hypothetical protein